MGRLDPSLNPTGAAPKREGRQMTCSFPKACLLCTDSEVFCGKLKMTTSGPAHVKILKSFTSYKATEFSLSLSFFFHEWSRPERPGIKELGDLLLL